MKLKNKSNPWFKQRWRLEIRI